MATSMVLQCPTCSQAFETTVEILNAHVASHYEDIVDLLKDATAIIEDDMSARSPSLKRKHSDDIELVMTSNAERSSLNTSSGKPGCFGQAVYGQI
jgi:transcription elongation factor Elf1